MGTESAMFRDDQQSPPELDPAIWEAFTEIHAAHAQYYGAVGDALESGALTEDEIETCLYHLQALKDVVEAADDEHEAAFNAYIEG